jgi:hypothetical protein
VRGGRMSVATPSNIAFDLATPPPVSVKGENSSTAAVGTRMPVPPPARPGGSGSQRAEVMHDQCVVEAAPAAPIHEHPTPPDVGRQVRRMPAAAAAAAPTMPAAVLATGPTPPQPLPQLPQPPPQLPQPPQPLPQLPQPPQPPPPSDGSQLDGGASQTGQQLPAGVARRRFVLHPSAPAPEGPILIGQHAAGRAAEEQGESTSDTAEAG